MRRMFVWLFVTLLCMQVSSVFAQDAKILEKSHKDLIKSLKKQYGLKDVSVKVEEDGFWYFLLTKKDGGQLYYGVADQSGKVIIPTYHDQIFYFPAMEAGTGKIPCYNEAGNFVEYMDIHYDKSDAVFLAKHDKASLYSSDGKLLRNFDSSLISYLPGYFVVGIEKQMAGVYLAWEANGYKYISKDLTINKQRHNLSLFTFAGKELINSAKKISFENNGSCIYTKHIDGNDKKGGFLQTNHSLQVPCLFYNTSYNETFKKWYIQRNSQDDNETFNPSTNYLVNYRDKGEEYFEKRMYDSVIRFYANEGISAPWAKFFTATALYHQSLAHTSLAKMTSEYIEKNETELISIYSKKAFDLNLAESQLLSSADLLDTYMKEDATYLDKAKSTKTQIKLSLEEIPALKQRYEKALVLLKQRKEEQRLAEIKRQQEAQQREKEIMMGILKIFANALAGGSNNSGSSYSGSSYSSGGSYKSSNSVSSSSQSNELSSGVQDRIRQLERDIKNETTYLENAQKRYESNPTAVAKREIEAHKRAIEGYKKQINDLKNGR